MGLGSTSDRDHHVDEHVLDALLRAIQSNKLIADGGAIDGTAHATAAALLVHRRVPREMERQSVLRLELLGEGVAASVWKAQLTVRHGHGPTLLAASKEARDGGGLARADTDREAALMSLVEHPHVLSLIGVVTVPRNMPALLLLEYCEMGSLDQHLQNAYTTGDVPMVLRLSFCVDIAAGMNYLSSHRIVHRDVAARNVSVAHREQGGVLQCTLCLPNTHDYGVHDTTSDMQSTKSALCFAFMPSPHVSIVLHRIDVHAHVWSFVFPRHFVALYHYRTYVCTCEVCCGVDILMTTLLLYQTSFSFSTGFRRSC